MRSASETNATAQTDLRARCTRWNLNINLQLLFSEGQVTRSLRSDLLVVSNNSRPTYRQARNQLPSAQ